jgi:hypothetical protein
MSTLHAGIRLTLPPGPPGRSGVPPGGSSATKVSAPVPPSIRTRWGPSGWERSTKATSSVPGMDSNLPPTRSPIPRVSPVSSFARWSSRCSRPRRSATRLRSGPRVTADILQLGEEAGGCLLDSAVAQFMADEDSPFQGSLAAPGERLDHRHRFRPGYRTGTALRGRRGDGPDHLFLHHVKNRDRPPLIAGSGRVHGEKEPLVVQEGGVPSPPLQPRDSDHGAHVDLVPVRAEIEDDDVSPGLGGGSVARDGGRGGDGGFLHQRGTEARVAL